MQNEVTTQYGRPGADPEAMPTVSIRDIGTWATERQIAFYRPRRIGGVVRVMVAGYRDIAFKEIDAVAGVPILVAEGRCSSRGRSYP